MNLSQATQMLKLIAENQKFVNSVSVGDPYSIWNTGEIKYGSVVFSFESSDINNYSSSFSVVMYYGDRLTENKSNQNDIFSDANTILNGIIGSLALTDNIEISYPITITYFEQKFADELSGGYVRFTFSTDNSDSCGWDGTVENIFNIDNSDVKNQTKEVTISNNGIINVTPDPDYTGLDLVVINTQIPIPEFRTQRKDMILSNNGFTSITPDETFNGLSLVNITVDVETPKIQENKELDITSNGSISVVPDTGFSGMSKVTLNIDIPEKEIRLQSKSVNITSNKETIIKADEDWDGLEEVVVITNIEIPTFETQAKTLNITTNGSTSITPDIGFDGLSSVSINVNVPSIIDPNLQDKSIEITSNITTNIIADPGFDGLSSVSINVNVPPSSIPCHLDLSGISAAGVFTPYSFISSITMPDNMTKVNNMANAFANYYKLTEITLPELPLVDNMYQCFMNCHDITRIILPELPLVDNMYQCFMDCHKLTEITLPELPLVTNMSRCFYGCYGITSIDLSASSKVKELAACFYNCFGLSDIILPELPSITNMRSCFNECRKLTNITIGQIGNSITSLSNWDINTCTVLTKQSLLNIINALPNPAVGDSQCAIGVTNLSKLSADEIEIATNKGWILV